MTVAETCGNCRFYRRNEDPNEPIGTGTCRWRPPTAMILPGPKMEPMQLNIWPGMGINDWCGQWESAHNNKPVNANVSGRHLIVDDLTTLDVSPLRDGE